MGFKKAGSSCVHATFDDNYTITFCCQLCKMYINSLPHNGNANRKMQSLLALNAYRVTLSHYQQANYRLKAHLNRMFFMECE